MTLTYDMTPPTFVAVATYAGLVDVSERTVKRWLASGELPDAVKDERGRWLIPANAERQISTGELVTLDPRPMTRHMTPTVPNLDELPSFLTVDQAAQLLDVSRHAILTPRGREYFDVVPFGVNGSFVIPLATIKRIRG